ncbi:hypothetical protein [Paenibacillus elgii]|uniref:hypothetical protein n=1 Tax=Paenibacillus elgii TaxID=189691 RepID=UPI00203E9F1D|nr:hypothetical protein [Paenibacillus elgii]MCM3272580.1 hypothetical protein [Paenibacillus elgii]
MIDILVLLKDGGYKNVKISPNLLGKLAESISKQGFEYITLMSGVITVVGFMVTGAQTGRRVIMIDGERPKAIETTETT